VDRIKEAINAAIRDWARVLPWPSLETWGEVTYTGGNYLYLPGNVHKAIWFVNTTSKHNVDQSSDTWDRDYTVPLCDDTVGDSYEFEDRGLSPTATPVSGPLAAFSTDASDTIGVFFGGMLQPSVTTGSLAPEFAKYNTVEEITLNGATPVTCTGSFLSLESIGKTDDSTGAIIIQCGGSTVAIIGPLENESTYRKIKIMYKPAVGTVFKYKGYCDPQKLKDTNQPVPHTISFDYLLWNATASILWDIRETERAMVAEQKAQYIVKKHIAREEMYGGEGGRIQPENFA